MENYIKEDIDNFLTPLNINYEIKKRNFTIKSNYEDITRLVYDVYIIGDIDLRGHKFETLPISFKEVQGNFLVSGIGLTKLTGSPKSVGGDFDCSNNKLTSLAYGPKIVKGDFNCSKNKIKNLTAPIGSIVGGNYICSNNKIEKLKRFPTKVGGYINLSNNLFSRIENLPENYSGRIDLTNNKNINYWNGIPSSSTILF